MNTAIVVLMMFWNVKGYTVGQTVHTFTGANAVQECNAAANKLHHRMGEYHSAEGFLATHYRLKKISCEVL